MIKVNHLDVLNMRRVSNPPHHFSFCIIELPYHKVNLVTRWISSHLKSKFYFAESLDLVDNKYVIKYKIGFEDHKELSFFFLACPYLQS